MTTRQRTKAHLDHWNKVFKSRPWGQYPPEELIRFVTRNYGDKKKRNAVRFLEVGCGPGTNIWYLTREGFTAAGIDGSESALAKARERLMADGLIDNANGIDLRQGNFASLPWDDETFDAVIDIEAIYANEMATIRSCIAEIHRVLKPGGLFFGKMFGTKTTGYGTGEIIENNTSLEPTEGIGVGFGLFHFFSEDELRDLFRLFASMNLDWMHRTSGEQTLSIFEWLVTAHK